MLNDKNLIVTDKYKIYKGNYKDLDIKDNSLKLIITDPPYGIKWTTSVGKDFHGSQLDKKIADKSLFKRGVYGDGSLNVMFEFIDYAYKKMADNSAMFLFTSHRKIDEVLRKVKDTGFKVKNIIIWNKLTHGIGDTPASYGNCYEMILLLNKGRCIRKGYRYKDIWECKGFNGSRIHYHPNQKPINLMKVMIAQYSNKGDVIFDAFMGSGSTGVASLRLGRKFIGAEIDEEYFKRAKYRLDNYRTENERVINKKRFSNYSEDYKQEKF